MLSCFLMCVMRFELCEKDLPQTRHLCGFSPEQRVRSLLEQIVSKTQEIKKSLVLELRVEFYIKQKSLFYLCNKVYDLTPTEPKFAPNTNSLNKPARSSAEQNV
jgi:hypothetical protein